MDSPSTVCNSPRGMEVFATLRLRRQEVRVRSEMSVTKFQSIRKLCFRYLQLYLETGQRESLVPPRGRSIEQVRLRPMRELLEALPELNRLRKHVPGKNSQDLVLGTLLGLLPLHMCDPRICLIGKSNIAPRMACHIRVECDLPQ